MKNSKRSNVDPFIVMDVMESARIAEKNKVNLEFEAAVAGGIPIIRTLKEGLVANKTKKIYDSKKKT